MTAKSVDELAKVIWDYSQLSHKLTSADAAIVMGSGDIRVAERASDLWQEKLVPFLVVSGGFGTREVAGWTITEAEKFSKIILANGVPRSAILIEDKATNSAENFQFSMEILNSRKISTHKLIVVTKPYMERRAFVTFRKLFPKIEVLVTSPQISYKDYPNLKISKDLMINIMVGDLQRIRVYPKQGFSISQKIPITVLDAMDKLIKVGYDKQLVI